MSLIYWLSKFSQEAMVLELFLIGALATSYFGYLLFQKRKYGISRKQIPDSVVRAYLINLISHAEGFKTQLFGEDFKIPLNAVAPPVVTMATSSQEGEVSADHANLQNLLNQAIARQNELTKAVGGLTKEKADLEAKLAAAGKAGPAAPAAAGGGNNQELLDKIAKLESKLGEYEVIEDDLANLKKYHQENKQLRAQLEALQKGGAPAPAPAPAVAAAPPPPPPAPVEAPAPPAPSPIAAAEETVKNNEAAQNFDALANKVEESIAPAPPAGASVRDPKETAQAQVAPPVTEAPPAPAAAAPPAAPEAKAAPVKEEKTDADLLNEFERMLSS